jgi:peroxiredoxin Q/BCP
MDAYRDQYATLFKAGQGVTLLAISTDPDTTLASWARDKAYPFTFLSDPEAEVGTLYGAAIPGRKLDNRTLFVIGKDGKIAQVMAPFREVDARAYPELEEAIGKALGG